MSQPPRPPRLAILLLRFAVPRTVREFIIGDLVEEYVRQAANGDPAGARRWFWKEARSVAKELWTYRDDSVPLTPPRPPLHGLGQDARFALRLFVRRPLAAAIAIVTLGLGIGASTAMFSVLKPVLLDAVPYPNANRIMLLWERDHEGTQSNVGFATFADLRNQSRRLDLVAAVRGWTPTLLGSGESARLTGQRVSWSFFRILGITPPLGRDFTEAEDQNGSPRVVVLSYGLWQRRFGGDPAVIGRVISLDGFPNTVVGILPADFESLLSPTAEIWSPLRYAVDLPYGCRTCRHLRAIGRLAPGVTREAALEEANLISNRLVAQYPKDYPAAGIFVEPLKVNLTKSSRPALLALFGAVALLLLVACLNVANLTLGQLLQRRREFEVRAALGSDRGRLLRQVLIESMMLGLAAAGLGLVVAAVAQRTIVALSPASLPRVAAIGLDQGVLSFNLGLGILAGLAFGIGPALWLTRARGTTLPGTGRATVGTEQHWLRRMMMTGEIAVAAILVVSAALVLRSMDRLLAVDPGFDPDHLLTMMVQTAGQKFDSLPINRHYFREVADRAAAVPGVASVAWTSQLPLGGNQDSYGMEIKSKPLANRSDAPYADRYGVTPGYFETMRIPLKAGRVFQATDRDSAPPVALINETFARLEFPGKSPIGEMVHMGEPERPWYTIVGVVGDVRHAGLDQPINRQIYIPETQWFFADDPLVLVARTSADPRAVEEGLRKAIRSVDPDPTISSVASMRLVIDGSTAARRFVLRLFQAFAGLALLLAAAGIYGVISSGVTERFRELGIRAALGASARQIQWLVVGEALRFSGAGVLLGLAGAAALSHTLQSVLYEVAPVDPLSYGLAGLILGAVALGASWLPARRAARLDPTVTLRAE